MVRAWGVELQVGGVCEGQYTLLLLVVRGSVSINRTNVAEVVEVCCKIVVVRGPEARPIFDPIPVVLPSPSKLLPLTPLTPSNRKTQKLVTYLSGKR